MVEAGIDDPSGRFQREGAYRKGRPAAAARVFAHRGRPPLTPPRSCIARVAHSRKSPLRRFEGGPEGRLESESKA